MPKIDRAADKRIYNLAMKLGSISQTALKLDKPTSTVHQAIIRHCDINGLKRPSFRKTTVPDGKTLYNRVLKLGSVEKVATSGGFDLSTAKAKLRKYCHDNGLVSPNGGLRKKDVAPISYPNEQKLKTKGIRRYIITSMHNNTPLDSKGFEALKRAAEHMGAQLCVIPLLYKNPSLFTSAQALTVEWPKEALPYTIHDNIIINDQWVIAGKLHVQATAARPLQGMQGFSKERSCVVGSARIAWETRPTPPGKPAICQITTGSISQPQYSDTKLGQLSDFHHTLGALLIETDGKETFVRHLRPSTKTGEFYDFEHHYGPEGYLGVDAESISAAVFGDLHQWFSTEQYLIQDFAARYKPSQLFIHDPIDTFSVSPHHEKDPLMRVAKRTLNMDKLDSEVEDLTQFHNQLRIAMHGKQVVYVASNHTDHIMRWFTAKSWQIIDGNTKTHRFLLNAYMEHLEDQSNALAYAERGELPSCLELLMKRAGADTAMTLFPSVNDSIAVFDIECAQHGHHGANGSKGTPGSFRQSQYKIIIGHLHSPGIYDGVYVVGTSSHLRLNYVKGLSSAMHAHSLIYRNGKRVLFTTQNGKHRLEET